MRVALFIGLVFIFGLDVAFAQDPVPQDTLQVSPVETDTLQNQSLSQNVQVNTQIESARPKYPIYPVLSPAVPGSNVVLTDSLIRWRSWLEYQEYLTGRPEVISHRLGAFGRTDLLLMSGLSSSQIEFRLDGMDWVNPVTGQPRLADVPVERLSQVTEREQGGRMVHESGLFSIYSPKPITRVSYLQTANELRNTDARVSTMLNHKSGFDIMYQGRNNASEYRRMGTESRQTGVRYFRHINEQWYATAMLIYTGSEHEESGGYQLPSLPNFNFNRFFANPLRQNAQSRVRSTQALVSLSRVNPDHEAKQNTTKSRFLIYYDRFKRAFTDTDVQFGYDIHKVNVGAEHAMNVGSFEMQGSMKAYTALVGSGSDLSIDRWSGYRAEANASMRIIPGIEIPAGIRLDGRSDGHQTLGMDVGARWNPIRWIQLSGNYSVGSQMPEIGVKYASKNVQRPDDLESGTYQRIKVELGFGSTDTGFSANLRGSFHQADNFTILSPERMYSQVNGVEFLTGSAGLNWNHENWEVGTTGLLQESNVTGSTELSLLNKTSVHWKGYVLSRAAYIRAGLSGTTSFLSVQTPFYHEILDDWSFRSSTQQIPAYSRLDIDLSARVRSLIVLFKYENVLQGVGQNGYYETAPFPMSSRRLLFGLRVVFIN